MDLNLDEEELAAAAGVSPAPTDSMDPNDPELVGDPYQVDPRVLEAREGRDRDVNTANLVQGISDIGASIASQGRVRANSPVFDSVRKEAETRATETTKDAMERRKQVSDFIKARAMAGKNASAEDWRQRNFEQRERGIEAQQNQRDKPTGDQSKVAGFGHRMEQAEADFSKLAGEGYNRADKMSVTGSIPGLPNFMKSDTRQRQEQAERNFLNAVLRRESGAAISPSEFDSGANQYFPRVGDSPEVQAQKKRNRDQVINSMKSESGNAWGKTKTITSDGGFPRRVTHPDGRSATVSSAQEAKEAAADGFR